MKHTILASLAIILLCAPAQAQLVIEEPVYGTVYLTGTYSSSDGITYILGSDINIFTGSCAVAYSYHSSANQWTIEEARGILEFPLLGFEMPESMTSQNFTARLLGLSGMPEDNNTNLNVFLYELATEHQDGVITIDDFDAFANDALTPISSEPFENGAFPAAGVDVTDALRRDLFGENAPSITTGFILMAQAPSGMILYGIPENARIEVNVHAGGDSDTGDPGDTASTDTEDTDPPEDTDTGRQKIEDPDVECSCRAAGARKARSLLSMLL